MNTLRYWNDFEIEKNKPYWIESPKDQKLQDFLKQRTNLYRCFKDAITYVEKYLGGIRGKVLDVGAGVAWTSAIISRFQSVTSVTAVDCSEHRLKYIAPIVFEQMHGDISKFMRYVKTFESADFEEKSFDIVIFCQSLYMFADIRRTLAKVARLLVPGGVVVVAAERITEELPILSFRYLRRTVSFLINGRQPDESGNFYYTDMEYKKAIKGAKLRYYFQPLNYPVFPECSVMAGNHFGLKSAGGGEKQ
jgi:ubiquinone/menaquinone biosynthesis C-methylase UbiE